MKKTTLFFVMAVMAIVFAGKNAKAQETAKYYEVMGYLKGQGYTICENVYCGLTQGATCNQSHEFVSGLDYIAIAFTSDNDVKDIDLYLYNGDNEIVKKDVTYDQSAALAFSVNYTQTMQFVYKNYNSATPNYASKCYLLVAYKSRY